jgi:hypothetical protein
VALPVKIYRRATLRERTKEDLKVESSSPLITF